MLTLYYASGTSSLAPHIALNEVGAEFDAIKIEMGPEGTRTDDFLKLNPAGKVPTLLVDGRPLTEVAATLFYIARSFPEAGLLPGNDDIEGQAQVLSWMSYAASGIHPVMLQGVEVAMPRFEVADQRLGDATWVHGDSYSIADIHLFRLYWRFTGRFEVPAGALPNLKRHHDRVIQRPAVQKTLAAEGLE